MSLLSLLVSSLLSAVVVLVLLSLLLLSLLLTGASSATPTTPTTDSNCACGCGCVCDDAAALPPWPTRILTLLRALGGWPVDEVEEEGWLLAWPNNRRSTWQNKGGKGRGVGEREVNEGGGGEREVHMLWWVINNAKRSVCEGGWGSWPKPL